MTELERRALLGDKQAQQECTEKGIVLMCPFCGKESIFDGETGMVYHPYQTECIIAGIYYTATEWNTRPAPPIGRCGECAHWYKQHCATGPCAAEKTDADFYCSNFKLRESEENG